jgi:CheY-like chemotaxis protein
MKRILVIDDDVQMRQMLKQMLERQGYEVVEAADGKEGIMHYRQEPTDLIITDIIMPNKEGVETIIELRHDFPDVKIIAISGGSRVLDAQDCLAYVKNLGASCVFSKPFERMELLEAIKGLLGESMEYVK